MDMGKFLANYVACRSVSSDDRSLGGMDDARKLLIETFRDLSIRASEVKIGRHAAVFAETERQTGRPTILVYGHYDVQPADDVELWTSDPFTLVQRNNRWYGRGASDNKGPVTAILAAIHDLLGERKKLPVNLKFVFEGEEEIG
ncbi:MAG: M20/M25/M40 family metallo-hydrolase, partial [Puniceicoccales bacterium]|nr:M20/M25/M40 family metallo-hydrolase [Puniceicoccales bacterium]